MGDGRSPLLLVVASLSIGLFAACSPSKKSEHAARATATPARASSAPGPPTSAPSPEEGDEQRGKALVAAFECNRCHDGTRHPAMATEKHCTHCHEDIATGRFGASSPRIAEWKRSVDPASRTRG